MEAENYQVMVNEKTAEAEVFLAEVSSVKIANADEAQSVADTLKKIKQRLNEIESNRVAMVKPLNDHVKTINEWFKRPLAIYEKAEAILKRTILAWNNSERDRIAEETRKANEAAAKKAESERQKLMKQSERAAEKGNMEKATEKYSQSLAVQQQEITPEIIQKPIGIQVRKTWDFEVIDSSFVPREYLIVDEKKIRETVRMSKGATSIPGVRVFEKEIMAV